MLAGHGCIWIGWLSMEMHREIILVKNSSRDRSIPIRTRGAYSKMKMAALSRLPAYGYDPFPPPSFFF